MQRGFSDFAMRQARAADEALGKSLGNGPNVQKVYARSAAKRQALQDRVRAITDPVKRDNMFNQLVHQEEMAHGGAKVTPEGLAHFRKIFDSWR